MFSLKTDGLVVKIRELSSRGVGSVHGPTRFGQHAFLAGFLGSIDEGATVTLSGTMDDSGSR